MSIKESRINSVLEKQIRYGLYGILTRREFIERVRDNGGTCIVEKLRDFNKEDREREWLHRNAFNHPFGNKCHPQTIAYNERKQALNDGIFVDQYIVVIPLPGIGETYMIIITKIEYDYFNSIKLQ